MTKTVRITNGDTSDYRVRVIAETLNADGVWVRENTQTNIDMPGMQTSQLIHSGRRLIIEEVGYGNWSIVYKGQNNE
jgi:hypothetical protein